MAAPLWNPIQAFGITNNDPGYCRQTCVGYAPSQRRRCRNPINMYNRDMADKVLLGLSLMRPCEATMLAVLPSLAEICLCVRYHRPQAQEVVRKWCRAIRMEEQRLQEQSSHASPSHGLHGVAAGTDRRQLGWHASRSGGTSTSGSTISTRSSSSSSTSGPSFDTWLDGLDSEYSSSRRSSISTSYGSAYSTMSSSTSSRVYTPSATSSDQSIGRATPSTSTLSSRTIGTNIITPVSSPVSNSGSSLPAVTVPRSNTTSALTNTASPDRNAIIAASSSYATSLPTANRSIITPRSTEPCTARHVPRRSAEGDCPICYESMAYTSRANLTWCKGQCGHSVHKACWALWRRESRCIPRCTYCRASWTRFCEHNETALPEFRWWDDDFNGIEKLFDVRGHILATISAWV